MVSGRTRTRGEVALLNLQQQFTAENPPTATYVAHMGSDLTVVNAARVSFGTCSEQLTEKDIKLIRYLAEHQHMSPFEHCTISINITCTIYISKQIMRHRTFSYNEVSRRYTSKDMDFYLPEYRPQATTNRQASTKDKHPRAAHYAEKTSLLQKQSLALYEAMVADGICREHARGVLPQNLNTRFIMTGNVRNWAHFITLRRHTGAQQEVRLLADQIYEILNTHFPAATEALLGVKK